MSERIDLEQVARQACGIGPVETMAQYVDRLRAERDAWASNCQRAEAEVTELMERNKTLQARVDALGEFCRNTPEMRELIGELRRIRELLEHGEPMAARVRLGHLLKRIDRESQEETR